MNTINRNSAHLKIGHIRGDGSVNPFAGQDRVGQLFVAAHIGNRGVRSGDITALFRVQSEGSLQGVILEKCAVTSGVLCDLESNLQFSAFSRNLIRRVFLPVQVIVQGNVPGDFHIRQFSLVIGFLSRCGKSDGIPILFNRVAGIQHFHGSIIAVVGNVPAGKAVDHITVFQLPIGIQCNVYNFFFF